MRDGSENLGVAGGGNRVNVMRNACQNGDALRDRPSVVPPSGSLLLRLVVCLVVWLSPESRVWAVDVLQPLNVQPGSITISGVSSGGWMAQQFHVVHSRMIRGVGIIAGGPYHWAAHPYYFSQFWDWTGLYVATSVCSNTNLLSVFSGPPQVRYSVEDTRTEAGTGTIDGLAHLAQGKIFLLTGGVDDVVPGPVMDVLRDYYLTFIDPSRINYVVLDHANHAMITDDFGSDCGSFQPPYINDCDFDASKAILHHLYGPLRPKATAAELSSPIAFDQTEFYDLDDESVSLGEVGYIYVPQVCGQQQACRIHVALHGCQQYAELIGDDFYAADAGYNEWAETNAIIVLYPQTRPWGSGWDWRKNPKGCWDWWSYTGADYHRRTGKQIKALAAMIERVAGAPMNR